MSEDKIKLKDSVRLFVSPADNGFACGVIEDEWMYTDEGYFCSVIARGMMKIACDNPQDVFEEGLEGFRLDLEYKKSIENTKSNGSDVLEDSKVINIVPFINKKKVELMCLEFWQWWLLSMVTINTVINSIVFFVGRKFKKEKK